MQNSYSKQQDIMQTTDQCVMCGLCLPHCPTYTVTKNEAESPRGRIALVRALHQDKLHASPALVSHLDQCLTCMSCEVVCPADVKFEKIIDAGREITQDQHAFLYRVKLSLLLSILTKTGFRKLVKTLLDVCHSLGVVHRLARLPLRIFRLIPKQRKLSFAKPTSSKTATGTCVALINSCASELFSDDTKTATKYILQALNCQIVEPDQTRCCGALHQHSGQPSKAKVLMRKFSKSFTDKNFDVLVSVATGCGAQVNRYPELLNDTDITRLIDKHMDINDFVKEQLKAHKLNFNPLPKKVLIHKPCSQKFVTKNLQVVEQLLSYIPDIQLKYFHDDLACCGAGGINTLTQTKLADNIIHNKITELDSSDADYLVTSNIGCALHFQAQLKNNNTSIIVSHPITLLAQQLLYYRNA